MLGTLPVLNRNSSVPQTGMAGHRLQSKSPGGTVAWEAVQGPSSERMGRWAGGCPHYRRELPLGEVRWALPEPPPTQRALVFSLVPHISGPQVTLQVQQGGPQPLSSRVVPSLPVASLVGLALHVPPASLPPPLPYAGRSPGAWPCWTPPAVPPRPSLPHSHC